MLEIQDANKDNQIKNKLEGKIVKKKNGGPK